MRENIKGRELKKEWEGEKKEWVAIKWEKRTKKIDRWWRVREEREREEKEGTDRERREKVKERN